MLSWSRLMHSRLASVTASMSAGSRMTMATRMASSQAVIRPVVVADGRGKKRRLAASAPFMAAGILGLLGLEKKEPEEEMDDEAKLIYNIKLGILAMQRGELEKSETILHLALRMAEDIENFDGVTYVYNVLANLAYEKGDYMKAEKLFKEVMKRILSTGTEQDDNKIVAMSLKLAAVYSAWKHDDSAVTGFRFCIDAQEKKIARGESDEDTLALWGMSRDMFAQFLVEKGRLEEAYVEFCAAHDTCVKLFGETHPQAIVLLNSKGTVLSMLSRHPEAVSDLERAVRLAEDVEDENKLTYVVNLGKAKIRQGQLDEGISLCKSAWRGAKKSDDLEAVVKEALDCIKDGNETKKKADTANSSSSSS